MSYARFGSNGSDVYVYLDVGGFLNCCACSLNPLEGDDALFPPSSHFMTTDTMLEHLRAHRAAGHTVPEYTFARLAEEREENDAFIGGDNG